MATIYISIFYINIFVATVVDGIVQLVATKDNFIYVATSVVGIVQLVVTKISIYI